MHGYWPTKTGILTSGQKLYRATNVPLKEASADDINSVFVHLLKSGITT